MKVALYWEDGLFQIALTPENEHDKMVRDTLLNMGDVTVKKGGFYACQGGWSRHDEAQYSDSVMLIKQRHPQPRGEEGE